MQVSLRALVRLIHFSLFPVKSNPGIHPGNERIKTQAFSAWREVLSVAHVISFSVSKRVVDRGPF